MKKERKIKEYCDCCRKWVIPQTKKLFTGGTMSFCPYCGLALSADVMPLDKILLKN